MSKTVTMSPEPKRVISGTFLMAHQGAKWAMLRLALENRWALRHPDEPRTNNPWTQKSIEERFGLDQGGLSKKERSGRLQSDTCKQITAVLGSGLEESTVVEYLRDPTENVWLLEHVEDPPLDWWLPHRST